MPLLFLFNEGLHVDHFGNIICPIYVDFCNPSERVPVARLVKGCLTEHAIETSQTVLISKPGRFRDLGENLIRDPGEAYASREELTYEAIDDPEHLAEARRGDQAVNRAYELAGANVRTNTTGVRTTRSKRQAFTFGRNGWIFCAAIEPTTPQEWELWRSTLQDDYDHVSYIERPREFARALATMVAEQQGPRGKPTQITHTFEDCPKLRTEHPVQVLYHGPVIYVDDVYALIQAATSKQEIMLLPLFAKATEYKDQREYRFAIFTETEPAAETVFLTASPALTGAMGQVVPTGGPQIMPPAEYLEDETGEAKEDDVDNECDDRTDQSEVNLVDLIDQVREESDGLHAFRQHAFDLASDPATVLRPNKLDPAAALLEEVAALTDTYPAVQALRSKVHEVRTAADLSPQQKLEAASAAWYAEQHIRSLCETFEDPISGISISPDSFVVVNVSLHERPDIGCKMAVAPSGECAMQLTAQRRQSAVRVETPWPRSTIGPAVRQFLEDAANPHG